MNNYSIKGDLTIEVEAINEEIALQQVQDILDYHEEVQTFNLTGIEEVDYHE